MITNITTGTDPARIQMGKPAFFVSWKIDGEQMYYFSAIRSSIETVKRQLETTQLRDRLEYLRGEIEAERISYSEIAELQELADYIDPSDTLLLEWAGVPEK